MKTRIPKSIDVQLAGRVALNADGGKRRVPTFEALCYSGKLITPRLDPPLKHPIVLDLAGMDLSRQRLPVLFAHDDKAVCGHSTSVETNGRVLTARGLISGAGPAAKEVLEASANGFEWQVSIGAALRKLQLVKSGERATVNQRTINGPAYVARASRMHELSLLPIPADDETAARIAAQKANMKTRKNSARAADATNTAAILDDEPIELEAEHDDGAGVDTLAEQRRVAAWEKFSGDNTTMAARAIAGGWEIGGPEFVRATQARELKDGLSGGLNLRARRGDSPESGAVMEAALCMAGGISGDFLAKQGVDKRTIDAATKPAFQRFGIQRLFRSVLEAAGLNSNVSGDDLIREAFRASQTMQAANFSTVSLPGILANTANKFLLEAFEAVDQSWRGIAARRPVSDFKEITSYRLTSDATFEELPPDGEIKHGTLGEESYPNRARTYAKMFVLTRVMVRNDDLGSMASMARVLGRGGALKLNEVFWTDFLDHASFFTAGNSNYISGAGTALSIAGLTAANTAFRRQTDADGNLLALTPRVLLVPPELEPTALALVASLNVNTGGASTEPQIPGANPFAGKFVVVVSPYLTDTAEWYLLANPNELAVMQVAFLDGVERPTVESADTSFDTLGVMLRGYWDWGVAKLDPRAGLKANGT